MKKTACVLVAVAFALAACTSDDPSADDGAGGGGANESADGLPKSMRVTLSGDLSMQLDCTGEEVGPGYIPNPTKPLFSIACVKVVGSELVDIAIGPAPGFFVAGTEVTAASILEIEADQGDGDSTEYGSLDNLLYYDTSRDGSQSNGFISFDRVETLPGAIEPLTRYHLVGRIRAPLVRGPTEDDPTHEACIQEAIDSAPQGERFPPYNAEVCQAKKIEMTGTFDIIQDFFIAK